MLNIDNIHLEDIYDIRYTSHSYVFYHNREEYKICITRGVLFDCYCFSNIEYDIPVDKVYYDYIKYRESLNDRSK